uniref:Uncharacterized protein n=1 Tax=Timema cristinae TaxID=61476 RepID=A0A7R9HE34_TIMCR|nr:unnamed protein product [Timema cristinae]
MTYIANKLCLCEASLTATSDKENCLSVELSSCALIETFYTKRNYQGLIELLAMVDKHSGAYGNLLPNSVSISSFVLPGGDIWMLTLEAAIVVFKVGVLLLRLKNLAVLFGQDCEFE